MSQLSMLAKVKRIGTFIFFKQNENTIVYA